MASTIEIAARKLAKKAARGAYEEKDVLAIIEAVKKCDTPDPITDQYRQKAKSIWEDEGQIEIDQNAVVSESENGAYVQAWVWVEKDDSDEEDIDPDTIEEDERCQD